MKDFNSFSSGFLQHWENTFQTCAIAHREVFLWFGAKNDIYEPKVNHIRCMLPEYLPLFFH
jgi:hypothetical protein